MRYCTRQSSGQTMTVRLHFLGWDAPVIHKVQNYLVPQPPEGPVDLRNTLVLVPTQQAGRRLREALTLFCARHGTYLMAPTLRTPAHILISNSSTSPPIATALDVAANWARVLEDIEPSEYQGLLPTPIPSRDFRWALRTGRMLESLRQTLAEHGHSIRSAVDQFATGIEELDRWTDMARLEQRAVQQMERLGLADPCSEMLRHTEQPSMGGFDSIVLACVPDPAPLSLTNLQRLSGTMSIEVLVHAPESMAYAFDSWGRPLADTWSAVQVEFPAADATIRLASSPAGQALLAIEILNHEDYGPGDTALGVPDNSVSPYLESSLAEHGVPVHNPAGVPLSRHPVLQLLSAYHEIRSEGSYESVAALLRHPDVLDHLHRAHGIGTRTLLTELDEYRNTHLPGTFHAIIERLGRSQSGTTSWPALLHAISIVKQLAIHAETDGAETAFRTVLQTIYSTRALRPEEAADTEFRTVADMVDEALRMISSGCIPHLKLGIQESSEVMLEMLTSERYPRERPRGAIDLEGWLELAWNDAPLLILTGMNDAFVPRRPSDEAFLPESLRRTLGLRNETDRLARDVFLTRTMVESRREHGRLYVIAAKYGSSGEPLKPSRILLKCPDEELPRRARRLFGNPDDQRPSLPSTISFRLSPHIPPTEDTSLKKPGRLSVSSLRDYLSCPFRFYLKHVLGMETLTDTKRELDALDFGTVVHDALAAMASDPAMGVCDDSGLLDRFLNDQVDRWTAEHLGANPPLHLRMQLDVVRDRLAAAATVQAEQVKLGWEITHYEERVALSIGSNTVRGRIDRVERHRDTGEYRVLDYKTTDNPSPPEKQHLGPDTGDAREYSRVYVEGKARKWVDLQLPLYTAMLADHLSHAGRIWAGYFSLPRDTDAAKIDTWEGLTESLLQAAMSCVGGILGDIENRRFWPPSARVPYEDFEPLFPAEASQCVDGQAFTDFLENWER